MPVLASTFYITKNQRRFRWDVSGSPSTWTDATHRYMKWTSGTGSLNVLELPMDGAAEIEYQVVAGGAGGGGGFMTYNYNGVIDGAAGGGGGAGEAKLGTLPISAIGSTPVVVGSGGEGVPYYIVGMGPGQSQSGSTNFSVGGQSSFGSVVATGGGGGPDRRATGGSGFSESPNYFNYYVGYGYGGGSGSGAFSANKQGSAFGSTASPPYYPSSEAEWNALSGGEGGSGKPSGAPSTLWDGSAYSLGGAGGKRGYVVANASGFGHGGSGGWGNWDFGRYYLTGVYPNFPSNSATYTDPENGASRAGLSGVVIVRWPLAAEAAG